MTHDDASVETGVGGQAKYDVMMVFFGIALQKHHKTVKTSTRRYSDCHILTAHPVLYYTCLLFGTCLLVFRSTQDRNGFEVLVQVLRHQITTTH